MEVVDGVEVHVLSVPGKGGLPHPEVEVGSVDSRNGHSILVHHAVQDGGQAIDVPLPHSGLSQSAWCEQGRLRTVNR